MNKLGKLTLIPFLFEVVLIFSILLSSITFAATSTTSTADEPTQIPIGLSQKIQNLYTWAVSLAGLVALGLIIYGGVVYASSAGNPSRITEAKAWITHALLGLFMLLGAYLILGFINPDLTKLDEVFLAQNVNPQSQVIELGPGAGIGGGEEETEPIPTQGEQPPGPVGEGEGIAVPIGVGPQEWEAAVSYDSWSDPWVAKDKLIIHFGGGSNEAGSLTTPESEQIEDEMTVLRSWEAYHLSKGWRGIAYNYAIGQSGTIYRLRGWNWNGGQYESDDVDGDGVSDNNESIAVVFILGGDQAPTSAALTAFESLRTYVEQAMGQSLPLYGHMEVAVSGGHSTNCPGPILMQYVTTHR